MADAAIARARPPLAEATNRINSAVPVSGQQAAKTYHEQHPAVAASDVPRAQHAAYEAQLDYRANSAPAQHAAPEAGPSAALTPPAEQDEAKRQSQASYASTSSSRSKKAYKTHIGPWQLGKTLGKGSSARVRLCRHSVTNQLAAVKIVNRRMAYLVQDSSLAALSKWDSNLPEKATGEMRVPMAIEREVAILKLIEHPNIMKLYDIWENRSEVYLILEYVDQGDLFTFINCKGRLNEEVSLYFFRQIISAISYCHSFNICHRDLKPENILITADLQIKIADFGMAALHQTDNHHLATACGSPHYAAPELLKNRQYRGDRADVWSLGVILYAMLSATLPFDDPDLRVMMGRTKKGQYEMPKGLSYEAEDLIHRMLQVNPERRITVKEIWRHPLVQRYSYLDDFGDANGQLPDMRKGFQYAPVPRHAVDPQLLRQLRSMWHMFSEADLALKLACEEPNDQKAFYWLLQNYREKQLEDFKPELAHSMSDYHHLHPDSWKKRISTCQFAQPRGNGHGRSVSRFTVISNVAEAEAETVHSYDPYRGSRMLQPCESQISHAKIIVHRDSVSGNANNATRLRSGSSARRARANSTKASVTSRPPSSRGSVSSLRSSRQGTPQARGPSLRHKRGVDFTHIRKGSSSVGRAPRGTRQPGPSIKVVDSNADQRPSSRSQSPELPKLPNGTYPKAKGAPTVRKDASALFNEELRHFSNNIAKDCDEAFRSSLIEDDSMAGSLTERERRQRDVTPLALSLEGNSDVTMTSTGPKSPWDSRPLPPLPSEEFLRSPPAGASTPASSRLTDIDDEDGVYETAIPVLLSKQTERRVVSAPIYNHGTRKPSVLPSINEDGATSATQYDKARIVSAPPHTPRKGNQQNGGMEYLSKVENTIRVVNSPTDSSPVKVPAPLNVRKKTVTKSAGRNLQGQWATQDSEVLTERAQDLSAPKPRDDMKKKKKSSWFKRSSKAESETGAAGGDLLGHGTSTVSGGRHASGSASSGAAPKKKSFSFPFWKSNKNRDSIMSIGDEPEKVADAGRIARRTGQNTAVRPAWHKSGSGNSRNIEVKQNWLARLFRVKPATGHLCMAISRKRARQEIAILLREWRRYGIKGIQVDKRRNIVFARLGPHNYLRLKEVAFAAEIMTVIEHGKRQPLSIVRFTQERGAASSFERVVETMRAMFDSRNLLVADKNKQKMMIKTLNA